MAEVTQILNAIKEGDQHAAERLLPLVYEELRKLAAVRLAQEKPGQTLQATALVHEAYMRLVGHHQDSASPLDKWDSQGHFFAAAAEAMRRILIDSARRKQRPKHGGGLGRVDLEQAVQVAQESPPELIDLDEALAKLAREEPIKAELVKLRFFAGMTMAEAAGVLGISVATAERYWTYARVWLYTELYDSPPAKSQS